MIYTNNTRKAIIFMYNKHKGQLDKSGIPYVFHPYEVAESMDDENSTIVALLHDILEDTDTTEEEIIALNFDEEVIKALRLLNHDKTVDYFEYIKKIKTNPLATKVKLSDLKHNSNLSRLEMIKEKDLERVKKYEESIKILELK